MLKLTIKTYLVIYSAKNYAVHEPGAAILLHQPSVLTELGVRPPGLLARVRSKAARAMQNGGIREPPVGLFFEPIVTIPGPNGATPAKQGRRALLLLDRALLLDSGVRVRFLEQFFKLRQPVLEVLIRASSLASRRWRTGRTFYVCLICALDIVTSSERTEDVAGLDQRRGIAYLDTVSAGKFPVTLYLPILAENACQDARGLARNRGNRGSGLGRRCLLLR